MNYKKFSRIYSISRVSRYKKAAKGNKKKAMAMYYANESAIKQYADSKGVGIAELSDEEKQRFMIPNPNYRKRRRHGIAAVF